MAYKVKSKKPKEKRLEKLRKSYSQERALRDEAVDYVKKIRFEKAKRTFADLDSKGKNPYFQSLNKREKYFIKVFNKKDKKLNKIDREIDELQRS